MIAVVPGGQGEQESDDSPKKPFAHADECTKMAPRLWLKALTEGSSKSWLLMAHAAPTESAESGLAYVSVWAGAAGQLRF